MTIWIDRPIWPAHGTVFAHLISDTSLAELHAFARRADLNPRAFEGDHYDVPAQRYDQVLLAGARPTSGAHVVRLLVASGLRLRKRRGDRPVARIPSVVLLDGSTVAVDLVASDRPVTATPVFAALAFVRNATDRFAVVHSVARDAWGSPGGHVEAGERPAEAVVREIREETGVAIGADDLEVCAYERFEGPAGRRYLQVFRTRAESAELRGSESDVDGWRWVTLDEFEALCGGEFWWPLVPALFS